MRMVIKENFGRDMVEMLYTDIMKAYDSLDQTTFIKEEVKERKNLTLLY
jgi:glutamate decarboxylase